MDDKEYKKLNDNLLALKKSRADFIRGKDIINMKTYLRDYDKLVTTLDRSELLKGLSETEINNKIYNDTLRVMEHFIKELEFKLNKTLY